MIAKIKLLKKYCSEYTKIEHYEEAVKSPLKYDLHHRREISENKSKKDLIDENLYYHRPPEELIFLEHGEHIRLHNLNSSEETRQKISEALKGNQNTLGYHFSEETKQKISESKKGKHPSAESRQKMSDAKKGKPKSIETRQRMSEARKGKHWHLENGHRIWIE